MFKANFILRLRALWRNRRHTTINIIGLSLGVTSTLVIFLIVKFELSYDRFRPDGDRIFRVIKKFDNGKGVSYRNSSLTYPLVPALRNDFPEAEYVSLVDKQHAVLRISEKNGTMAKFREDAIAFVDSSYFRIITQQWIEGNEHALDKANTAVLTESVARKFFGNGEALNRVIHFNNEFEVTVTGVVKDPPLNTDFRFNVYISSHLGSFKRGWDSWSASASNVNCMVKLREGVAQSDVERKLKGWHLKYVAAAEQEDAKNENALLQPLSEMHFDREFYNPGGRIVSRESMWTIGLIGGLLLLTACVNFINLNSVLIIDRSKETGVRKVMGSTRYQLVSNFITETLLITVVSLLLSSGLTELMLMQLSPVLGYRLSYEPFSDSTTFFFLMVVVITVTLMAGLYPALKLAWFNPVEALKNRINAGQGKGITLRRALIVFQLIISQVLIVCTIITVQQLNHFMKQPLGLDSHAVVEFEIPENGAQRMRLLADRIAAIPGVENFTASNSGAIAGGTWSGDFEATVGGKMVKENTVVKMADNNYLDTYRIELIYGENVVRSDSATRFVVNESFTKALGFTDPREAIGVPVNMWGKHAQITGIMKDFNTMPLHTRIRPTILLCDATSYYVGAVRIKVTDMKQTLAQVKETWEALFPDHVYEQHFLDDVIRGFYDGERKMSYLIGLFAGIAIFIGCIGLFGLISFMAQRKTKEVGIRKTLGASVMQVVGLFTREFMMLTGTAFIVSVPVAYYFMNEWLRSFVYRIHPGVTTFLMGGILTCFVVLATVGIRSFKAAMANPVDALRDE